MNRNHAIKEQLPERKFQPPTPIDSAGSYVAADAGHREMREFISGSAKKIIRGQLLSVHGDVGLPVQSARIELYAVTPLRQVINGMTKAVLTHCRKLLLETPMPIDLYRSGGHIADKPSISFADVQRMHEIPGYELLAAAARTQEDKYFRHLLSSNLSIARLLLCYYHPASFCALHTANALTDTLGHFQCAVLEQRNGDDKPGYLFVARQKISNNLYATLYHPTPATWYVHWDLSSDAAITLSTRHPLALRKNSPT